MRLEMDVPTRRGILPSHRGVSLLRCPHPYEPASGAGSGTRNIGSFASWLATDQWSLTSNRPSLAAELTCIQDLNALSGRSSDVAWGGLYGRISTGSRPLLPSGSSSARSLRQVCVAGHRVSNASAPPGAAEMSKHSHLREPNQKVGTSS